MNIVPVLTMILPSFVLALPGLGGESTSGTPLLALTPPTTQAAPIFTVSSRLGFADKDQPNAIPAGTSSPQRATPETPLYQYDAQCHGDHGQLMVTAVDIRWRDLDHPERSQAWPYNVIRTFKRSQSDHQVKLQTDSRETIIFKLASDQAMTDVAYESVQRQIAAAE